MAAFKGVIYVIGSFEDLKYVKIELSRQITNKGRLNQLQTGNHSICMHGPSIMGPVAVSGVREKHSQSAVRVQVPRRMHSLHPEQAMSLVAGLVDEYDSIRIAA
ncbi:hypothetical protein ABID21_001153 [Pseudorhizobium tarimense]|uniref:Uncharacterized protein n=1 Tax=Pseudorhizobium tarimense TaxID=1079109 RepID=A0ABV2H3D4_9HYPH|nr:hypothetical protein [Pseudorhizobium tarimense]MCJ8518523.1 hypothetical protein [Pseudorhizobium tarimense]